MTESPQDQKPGADDATVLSPPPTRSTPAPEPPPIPQSTRLGTGVSPQTDNITGAPAGMMVGMSTDIGSGSGMSRMTAAVPVSAPRPLWLAALTGGALGLLLFAATALLWRLR